MEEHFTNIRIKNAGQEFHQTNNLRPMLYIYPLKSVADSIR